MSELFDSHVHLTRHFFDDDAGVEAAIARAHEAGVTRMTTIGSGGALSVCDEAIALAERHDQIWASVGYHPHNAADCTDEALARIEELAAHDKVVAIGETGLDYHYMNSPKETQQAVFRRFVALARRVDLPVIIHTRDAEDDTLEILESEQARDCGGVIHCYSSSWELARRALDLGFYISFSGMVSFKRSEGLREAARKVPADRLLVETDAPFLAPVPRRGKRNEPAFVSHTARCVAEARGEDPEAIAAVTTENARRFYRV